jgi:transposase
LEDGGSLWNAGEIGGEKMDGQPLLSTVSFRLVSLEKELMEVKKQLNMYVPLRENDLQLKTIHETVDRIEKQLAGLGEKILAQEFEMQKREAAAQRRQASLQIKILWGTVSTIVGLLTSVLVGYITHLFH